MTETMLPTGSHVTQLLQRSARKEKSASRDLAALVYEELRRVTAHTLPRQGPAGAIQPTSIVHDAYVRLFEHESIAWEDRAHFLGVAAVAVRRVLVDRYRRDGAVKRGGGWERISLDEQAGLPGECEWELLALDVALEKLARLDGRQARIIELRFFGALTVAQVAEVLGVSVRTVEDDWRMARAWLARELR